MLYDNGKQLLKSINEKYKNMGGTGITVPVPPIVINYANISSIDRFTLLAYIPPNLSK